MDTEHSGPSFYYQQMAVFLDNSILSEMHQDVRYWMLDRRGILSILSLPFS